MGWRRRPEDCDDELPRRRDAKLRRVMGVSRSWYDLINRVLESPWFCGFEMIICNSFRFCYF